MSFISDLVNGKEIPLQNGGAYSIQEKEGSDVVILNVPQGSVFSQSDVNRLISALQILRQAKILEK